MKEFWPIHSYSIGILQTTLIGSSYMQDSLYRVSKAIFDLNISATLLATNDLHRRSRTEFESHQTYIRGILAVFDSSISFFNLTPMVAACNSSFGMEWYRVLRSLILKNEIAEQASSLASTKTWKSISHSQKLWIVASIHIKVVVNIFVPFNSRLPTLLHKYFWHNNKISREAKGVKYRHDQI